MTSTTVVVVEVALKGVECTSFRCYIVDINESERLAIIESPI